jgi:hypothetical protein
MECEGRDLNPRPLQYNSAGVSALQKADCRTFRPQLQGSVKDVPKACCVTTRVSARASACSQFPAL